MNSKWLDCDHKVNMPFINIDEKGCKSLLLTVLFAILIIPDHEMDIKSTFIRYNCDRIYKKVPFSHTKFDPFFDL